MISEHEFVEKEIDQIPIETVACLDLKVVRLNLSKSYQEHVRRTNDIAFARSFQRYCPIAGALTEDYLYKVLEHGNIRLWTSLRFWSGDTARPFIELLYYSCSLQQLIDDIGSIRERIHQSYQHFKLIGIRLSCYEENYHLFEGMDHETDDLLVAKPLKELSLLQERSDVSVQRIQALTAEEYAVYSENYALFNSENPELKHVKAIEREKLNNEIGSGFGYKVLHNTDWVGIIVIIPDFYECYYGYYMSEKLIFAQFQGGGFSTVAQNLIEMEIVKQSGSEKGYLFGTISPENGSSLRSALRTGRKVVLRKIML